MRSTQKIYRNLFTSILVLLFIPFSQMQFSIVKVQPLNGSINKIVKPEFNFESWFFEEFQVQTEKYLNQNFGFRNWLVRLNNQLRYSLFNKAQARKVIIGKENYLFEDSYINAYFGKDFLGKKDIDEQIWKLRVIQDSLKTHGVDVILVFAPSKGSFYPEYIPEKYDTICGITNHEYYIEQSIGMGINYIDFSTWFKNMKNTSNYCLYPKTGIHWSYYGMNLVTDSLVRYIENLKKIDMPDLLWDTIEVKKEIFGVDKDIEDGMNLLFPISNFAMPYPKITIDQTNKTKPKAIVVADSFYWQLHSAGYSKSIFDHGEFWFYNNMVYPSRGRDKTRVRDLNLNEELQNTDVIILLCTEPVLKRKFWGFIDNSYNELINKESNKEEKIQLIISKILNNKEWSENIKNKAAKKQIEFEKMLRMDAEYIYNKSKNKLED